MGEEVDKNGTKHLTAKELLITRGIRVKAYEELEHASQWLPKNGLKLFEPSGSWLENKQIEKNLTTRRDLIKVERVNRLSQLAGAVWLPDEKRAKVIKRSGIDWRYYGTEIDKNLYLNPEEALLLLEMNQLELTWNDLPLSIQQAYEVLLDSSKTDCSLDEYRIYSHLVRIGYYLQRYQKDNSTVEKVDEVYQLKKKVFVDPQNGNWMGKHMSESLTSTFDESENIEKEVEEIIQNIICNIESAEENSESNGMIEKSNGIMKNEEKHKDKGSKLEIISEETVLNPITFIRSPLKNEQVSNSPQKWTGARIQRNVKLLPKRTDKNVKSDLQIPEKRKNDDQLETLEAKKLRHEVIDLSDDEIEEVPRSMTRLEMLNCLPNIASKKKITDTILIDYIPSNIKPLKTVYEFDCSHFKSQQRIDKTKRASSKSGTNQSAQNIVPYRTQNTNQNSMNTNFQRPQFYQRSNYHQNHNSQNWYPYRRGHNNQRNYNGGNNYFPQPMMQNYSHHQLRYNFQNNFMRMDISMGVYFYNNMMNTAQQLFRGRRPGSNFGPRFPGRFQNFSNPRNPPPRSRQNFSNEESINVPSFVKLPSCSWSELKEKWKEAKTITIDDEDEKMDCNEVELVRQTIRPLVNVKNCRNFADVYNRLRIIKPAHDKNVRRKKGDYKISYKVYGLSTTFRKSSPGTPIFHVVVVSSSSEFLQPVDLNRLQQDSGEVTIVVGLVSDLTISYIQTGTVSLPNLHNECANL